MNSKDYWEKRALEELTSAEMKAEPYMKKIYGIYTDAQRQTVKSIQHLYQTYYAENKWDTTALNAISPSGDLVKFYNQLKAAGLEKRLPERFNGRLSRLELMNAELWLSAKKVAQKHNEIETTAHSNTVKDAYYRTVYDSAKKLGATEAFSTLDNKAINKILRTKFAGANYSERIWGNTDRLADSLQEIIGKAVALGQSPEVTARMVRERFRVSQYAAMRLVRTETAYFDNYSAVEAYKEIGIEKLQFIATLDMRTSDMCRAADKTIIPINKAKIGENVPPLHPWCRSRVTAYFGKDYKINERIARDPKTGKNYFIQGDMSYPAWRKTIENIANRNKTSAKINSASFNAERVRMAESEPIYKPFSDEEIMHLDESAEQVINLAPREEDYALENYTGLTFDPINKYLYGTYEGNANIIQDIKALDSLLERFKTPRDATVFRAIRKKDYAKYIEGGEGTKFVQKGFVSTSTKEHIAKEFLDHYIETGQEALMAEIRVPKGTSGFFVGPRSMHSHAYNEAELLLKRGLTYKIKAVSDDKIILEVILDEK